MTSTLPAHGTLHRRKIHRCGCTPCRAAERAYDNNRTRQIAYQRWQPYVDAEPVRQHVRTLTAAGLGWQRVAQLAGVPRNTVEKLLYGAPYRGMGPSKRVRPETAAKLLAVTRPTPAPGALVDATGTRRRMQALVAAGWPQTQLAQRLRLDKKAFNHTITADTVRASTAAAATALYDQLWRQDPAGHGVDNQAIARSRNRARQLAWAPVGAWDDDTIDNPAALPDWTGQCGTPRGYDAHRHQGIPACQRCKTAWTQAAIARRNARKDTAA